MRLSRHRRLVRRTRLQAKRPARSAVAESYLWDNGICELCRRRHAIEVHHILGGAYGRPGERWNMLAVCRECHEHTKARTLEAVQVKCRKREWDAVAAAKCGWRGVLTGATDGPV